MPKLIQKSGYIKSGGGAKNYMSYIATRDGVEIISDRSQGEQYLSYIAQRPRSHGLFSDADDVDLNGTMKEIQSHDGPVWTIIYSLKREDAARLGFDSAKSWRDVLRSKQLELAAAMKISPKNFRWCAAFHDEATHPHVHMMIWSADPKEGHLTKQGIEKMRSAVTNEIFQDELLELYQTKDVSYKEVVEEAQRSMRQLIGEMGSSLTASPVIEEMISGLAVELGGVKGKKVYGYLKKSLKEKVDAIVDELARMPSVAKCYEAWNVLRDQVESYYKDKQREHLPLSRQKEFRSIKNIVIREAERVRLGEFTFEDRDQRDEFDGEEYTAPQTKRELLMAYQEAKAILSDNDTSRSEKEEAVRTLEVLWDEGLTVAAHQLGKCWRDGLGVIPDDEKAEAWFKRSADAGNDFSQYALGKLLQERGRITEAIKWYEKASAQGNQYAAYRLGKMYLAGKEVPKDVARALEYLTASAEGGNQYAQYALGKLYLMGQDVPQDREEARYWLTVSATQGNEYARFFLDRWDSIGKPSVMVSITRLLHNIAQTFRAAPLPHDSTSVRPQMDRKLRQRIREKKMAMGHKADDHEEYQGPTMSM